MIGADEKMNHILVDLMAQENGRTDLSQLHKLVLNSYNSLHSCLYLSLLPSHIDSKLQQEY